MAGSNWPLLQHLDLSSNRLTASVISQLTQLRWSNVETLDLINNPYLGPNAVQELSSGSWPRLKGLAVSGAFKLGLLVQLAASSWPLLETIQINCNYSAPQAGSFAGCWQNIKNLQITFRFPSILGSSWLIEAAWPNLHTLDLSYSNLGRSGMMHLAQGRSPLLSKLDISRLQQSYVLTPFEYANFASLASWPKLTCLGLAHNAMYDECVAQLICGDWPLLTTSDLSYK